MRIRGAMEAIAALALAAAMIRGQAQEPIMRAWLRGAPFGMYLRVGGGNLITALALVGGASLAVETLRRRGPAVWGLGRWTWSIAGLFAALNLAGVVVGLLLMQARRTGTCPTAEVLNRVVHQACTDQFLFDASWMVAALWVTARIDPARRDPEPDLRERLGGQFAALIVATGLSYRIVSALAL